MTSRSATTSKGGLDSGHAVTEQSAKGGVEVLARCLVLPGEGAAHEHIGVPGSPADDRVLLFEQVTFSAAGLGDPLQLAQIQKMALRALLFIDVVGRPGVAAWLALFGDEGLRRHCVAEARPTTSASQVFKLLPSEAAEAAAL